MCVDNRGDRHERNRIEPRLLAHFDGEREAVDLGKSKIDDGKVWPELGESNERRRSVMRDINYMAERLQDESQHLSGIDVVVDDEEPSIEHGCEHGRDGDFCRVPR